MAETDFAQALAGQPRARGAARLRVKARHRTAIDELYQSGSLKLLFPRARAGAMEAVLLNTAGGITGGDRFEVQAEALEGTALTITTQAAERAYRAQPGQTGHLSTSLAVHPDARINWLPQETILFNGSALRRRLSVDLAAGASLLLAEPLVFGRAAMGEALTEARFSDRIRLCRRGQPLFTDATELRGDISAHLARPFIANGAGAMALVVFAAPQAEAALPQVRALLPEPAGASLIGEDILVARVLADDSFTLRRSLIPLLTCLNGGPLPRCWMT